MMTETLNKKISWWLLAALLFSSFLVPNIPVVSGFPKLHPTDVLLPFFLLMVLLNFRMDLLRNAKWFLIANGVLLLVAVLSIVVNHRLRVLRDDFEVMKLAKFIIVTVFVILVANGRDLMKLLRVIFILVFVFNFLHYTDLFGFNHAVMKYYGSDIQVYTFGLNSLGQPDTKRIIGTVGNPNNNAVLFLFFVIFFFPEKKSTVIEKVFFLLAVFGTIACQSRTGFIAFGVIFIAGSILKKYDLLTTAIYSGGFIAMFYLMTLLGNLYLNSLGGNILKQNSVRERLETWKMLWGMIKQKPMLGYSPYKDYFYDNNIYAESEYIQNAWRYGFVGLLAYLSYMWSAFYSAFLHRESKYGSMFLLITIVIGITAITNTPLSDPLLYMLYAFSAGLFFSEINKKERGAT